MPTKKVGKFFLKIFMLFVCSSSVFAADGFVFYLPKGINKKEVQKVLTIFLTRFGILL